MKCSCMTCRVGRILARAIMTLGSLGAAATAATIGVKVAPAGSVVQYICSLAMWAGFGGACYYVNRLSAAIMTGGRS